MIGFISASLGRPVAIQDEDFDLGYPCASLCVSHLIRSTHTDTSITLRLTINDDALDRWNSAPLERPSPSPNLVESLEWLSRLARIQGNVLKSTHALRSCPKPAQEMWPGVQELKAELDECEFLLGTSEGSIAYTDSLIRYAGITSLPPRLSW